MSQHKDIFCFVHIEKAAGTTLKHIFRRTFYFRHLTVRPYFKPKNYSNKPYSGIFTAKDLQLVLLLNPFTKIISGHSLKPYSNLEITKRRVRYITLLRDPVQRYLSHFEYATRQEKNGITFDQFMNKKEHKNFQTKKIAGKEDLHLAKKTIKDKFFVVGVVEQFEIFLALLSFKLNLKKSIKVYDIRNRGERKNLITNLYKKYYKKIVNDNKLDIELYNYVVKNILPKNKAEIAEYVKASTKTEYRKNLTAIEVLKLKSDFYLESVYYQPVTNMIRRINGLKPYGSYY